MGNGCRLAAKSSVGSERPLVGVLMYVRCTSSLYRAAIKTEKVEGTSERPSSRSGSKQDDVDDYDDDVGRNVIPANSKMGDK